MEKRIKVLENCHIEVTVTVDKDLWAKAQKTAFVKLSSNVTVPGFRPGKAPAHLLKGRVDQGKVFDKAINDVLKTVIDDILTNQDIKPMMPPSVDVTKLSEEELELKITFVTEPKIDLGEYKGHNIGKVEVNVTDDDVNNAIDELRKNYSTIALKDGPSVLGDTVIFDFSGEMNGVPFDGGTANNYELELGSHKFIPGFEEQLVGLTAGVETSINVKFPDQYPAPELAGKDAVFHVKIHEVKQKILPEIDDEFIKDLKFKDVSNLDQLKENRRAFLLENKQSNARREYNTKLMDKIIEVSSYDIADEIVKQEMDRQMKDYEAQLMQQTGLSIEKYFEFTKTNREKYESDMREGCLKSLKTYLTYNHIAEKEKLAPSEEEVEFEIAKLADQYQMNIDDIKKALGQQLSAFSHNILTQKVEQFLYDNNN